MAETSHGESSSIQHARPSCAPFIQAVVEYGSAGVGSLLPCSSWQLASMMSNIQVIHVAELLVMEIQR